MSRESYEDWARWQKSVIREEARQDLVEREKQNKHGRGKAAGGQRLPQPGRRLPYDFHR